MARMKKKRLREKKELIDPLKGWTMKSEPIKDMIRFQTEIDKWLSVEGAKVIYDDYGGIEAVYHPSCESDSNPHFHMIIIEKEK